MRKSLKFIGRIVSAGLAGLLTFGSPGCTMPRPVYGPNGEYLYEERVSDAGENLRLIGMINGGLLGLLIQAEGSHLSKDQRERIDAESRRNMQRQIDALNQGNGSVQPYPEQAGFRRVYTGPMGPSEALKVNQKDGREIPLRTRSLVPEAIDYSREEKSPIGIRLNSEVGVAPMKVSYFALLPSDLTEEHSCSWAINNVPVSTGHKGWTVLKEPGEYTVELDFVNAHGQEFVARRTVNVLERITAGGQGN